MQAGRTYSLWQTVFWTRKSLFIFLFTASIPVILYELLDLKWLTVPWLPIALVGTAVAFYLGFKNNSSYERLWEARKIWGAIVNDSRSWAISIRDFITNEYASEKLSEEELIVIHKRFIHRHIGWLTALKYQLREPKPWEHTDKNSNNSRKYLGTFDLTTKFEDLDKLLSKEEINYLKNKKNCAAHIISLQSKDLRDMKSVGLIDDFRHMELQKILMALYNHQGKSERIKNFPFPRQYATVNLFFVWLFIILVPFGMVNEFDKLGEHFVWLTIPFSIVVSWVFHTMEMIGDFSENPFEGLHNDVPINQLSRVIEIDLREMMDEKDIPDNIQPVTAHKILV
jgi:putative membrane protein